MRPLLTITLITAFITSYSQHAIAGEGSYSTNDLNAEAREVVSTERSGFTEEDAKRTAAEAIIYGRYVGSKEFGGSSFGADRRMQRRQLNRSQNFIRSQRQN